jgi:hypothetical protein
MRNNKNAPIDINISAKLKIAKYFTPIKSITEPTNTLSSPFETAHERMRVYVSFVKGRFLCCS